ncbi:sphingosine-1-phosphate phosphatase 2 [Tachysurus ichikawai]
MWSVVSYLSSSELVAGFQRACGLFPAPRATHVRSTKTHRLANGTSPTCQDGEHAENGRTCDVRNWPLYFLFVVSANLGNEVFYISFLPFIHWNLDPFLCRRLVNMWAVRDKNTKTN